MSSSLDKARVVFSTSMMIEAVIQNKDSEWFNLFQRGECDKTDLEFTFLMMMQQKDLDYFKFENITKSRAKRLSIRLDSIDYEFGATVIRLWRVLGLSNMEPKERLKVYKNLAIEHFHF